MIRFIINMPKGLQITHHILFFYVDEMHHLFITSLFIKYAIINFGLLHNFCYVLAHLKFFSYHSRNMQRRNSCNKIGPHVVLIKSDLEEKKIRRIKRLQKNLDRLKSKLDQTSSPKIVVHPL